jgi:spore germination cell wall hydrolase CwlJ-like protein
MITLRAVVAAVFIFAAGHTLGQAITEAQAVRAIVGESAGESFRGKLAVACAIRNRGTLAGVCGIAACHTDREPERVWREARAAWRESAGRDITGGATHWESTNFKSPAWASSMRETVRIGHHRFYRPSL